MSTMSNVIIKDRELEQYYDEDINNVHNHDHQQRYGNQFVWELARHSLGEEFVVYPALEKYLGDRGQNYMASSDEGYISKLRQIWMSLEERIKDEERDLLALEEKLLITDGESSSMTKSFSRTKAFVASRSHPSAGDNPPFETAMGLLTAPIDYAADIFRKFPDETVSPNQSAKQPT